MGTEIQANAFFTENQHMIDLNGNGRNGLISMRHDNQIMRNGQDPEPPMTQAYQNGYSEYDLQKMRQTILKQESVFRNQLQELHRLYRRQQDLMNEINTAEIKKSPNLMFANIADVSANSFSNSHREPKDFLRNSLNAVNGGFALVNSELSGGRTWNEHPFDGQAERRMGARCDTRDFCHAKSQLRSESVQSRNGPLSSPLQIGDTRDFCHAKSQMGSESVQSRNGPLSSPLQIGDTREFCHAKSQMRSESVQSRNGPLSSPLQIGEPLFPKKRKIFGVEILEVNNDSCNAASNTFTAVRTIDSRNTEPFWMNKSSSSKQNVTPQLASHHLVSTFPPSWNSKSFLQDLELGKNVKDGCVSIGPSTYGGSDRHASIDIETPQGGLPWFHGNTLSNGESSKGTKSSYFMNLDSLQNCSRSFFSRGEVANGCFPNLNQKKEVSASMNALYDVGGRNEMYSKSQSATKILGFPISDSLNGFKDLNSANMIFSCGGAEEKKKDENEHPNQVKAMILDRVSNLRHHIDLNVSLDEEDSPPAPSLPTAVIKITTTEIDLEAPAVTEFEADASSEETNSSKAEVSRGESGISNEECDKSAADALICLSSFGLNTLLDRDARELPESESTDCLKLFAEIISSQSENAKDQDRVFDDEDPILDGMDHFEFMTLKLEDTKNQNYLYNPMILNIPNDEETQPDATVYKPSRRGQFRRGRYQKDFQRDILPGIATLSRHEMKEDAKAFEEIHRGEASARNESKTNSAKKTKGRRRTVSPSTSPQAKPHCSTQTPLQPVSQEPSLLEGNLVRWGKKTRRLPRQRSQSLYLSAPVKC